MNQFFTYYDIKHVTGMPHKPKGQVIVERSNGTFKKMLNRKQGTTKMPQKQITCFINLKFFKNAKEQKAMAVRRHCIVKTTC